MGVDKSGQRVQRMFGEIAGNYDRMNHLLSMQTDRYWRWRAARRTKPTGDAPILDVCTGTGDLAFALLRASGGKAPVVATDFCQPMLDIGRQKKIARGIDGQLEFMQADAQNLPFPDNHFQIVTVAFGLRNVADTDQGLREMTRVCQVGGRVAVLEFTMPRTPGIRQLYGWANGWPAIRSRPTNTCPKAWGSSLRTKRSPSECAKRGFRGSISTRSPLASRPYTWG